MNGQDRTTLRVSSERAGLRADVFFSLAFPFLSRTRIRQKIQQGEALLNGRRFATSARVREGDEITVAWRGPVPDEEPAADAPPVILFEDAWFVAVDKPAGQASHPSGGIQSATLIQQVRRHLRTSTEARMAAGDRAAWPTLVNRLDRFTSGVVLVTRTAAALTSMQRLRGEGLVERGYLAVVEGRLADDTGTIDAPIGPAVQESPAAGSSTAVGIRMVVTPDGLPSRTEYRVLERGDGFTVLRAVPRTGRQHQIRVHFASIGHPVVGDLIYRDEALFLRYWRNGCRLDESLPPRHLLHAERLAFDHPFTGRRLEIEAPVPVDFTAALAALALPRPASP
jgi:23S rRNA pseudouridine1911/1915/1917 synthase